MLGFDQIIESQKITPVIEECSPDFESHTAPLRNGFNFQTQNNSSARSEFIRDVLEDVCDDFERTLKRTKMKRRGQRSYSDNYDFGDRYDDYDETFYDNVDSCITSNTYKNGDCVNHTKLEPPVYRKPSKDNKVLNELSPTLSVPSNNEVDCESIASNGSEVSTGALQNIREQMALSLKKMRALEEQVKLVPVLQNELLTLKKEKQQLEGKIKDAEARRHTAAAYNPPNQHKAKRFKNVMHHK
ncbi:KN motif and ankyrin repeat domain-containing protein 2, partial [Pseudolycoriella hygida]